MAPDVSGGLRNPPQAVKNNKHVLKKGPWTSSEDMILIEYVRKHGEGNWNAVQRNSGLMRCGKSCRLRWANHLRPNLKKGAFSADEEKLIVELHAKLGNKWARMASQIPGRTDNEIKNYWNTRLKRRQRAGLPVYPHEIAHHELNSSPPPPPSLSSLFASNPNPNPLRFYDPTAISPPQNQPYNNNNPYLNQQQLQLYRDSNGGLALSLAASNPSFFSTNQTPVYDSNSLPIVQHNSFINSAPDMGVLGLPSIQSSSTSSSDFVMGTTSSEEYEAEPGFEPRNNNSGLLEDLLGESHHVLEKTKDSVIAGDGDVNEEPAALGVVYGYGYVSNYEGTETKDPGEGISTMDDDILNLLDNFPLSVPIPDWNEERHKTESPVLTNGAIENQPNGSMYNPIATSSRAENHQDWNFRSCLWNNMPSIY